MLGLLLSLGGCKTWEAAPSPRTAIADARPASVRVTTANGRALTVRNPIFVNDSLVSGSPPPPGMAVIPPRVGVLESEVNTVEIPRFNLARTIAFAGAIVGASLTWARVQGVGLGGEPRDPPLPKDSAFELTAVFRLLVGSR